MQEIFALGSGRLEIFFKFTSIPVPLKLIFLASRPVYQTGELVPPSDLASYRVSHEFRAPSCLCIVPSGNAVGVRYAESAIYLAVAGEYWREYVAGCPTGSCAYLSKSIYLYSKTYLIPNLALLVELERLYSKGGLLTKRYPLRGTWTFQNLHLYIMNYIVICSAASTLSYQ